MQVNPPWQLHVDDSARAELDLRHLPSPEPMLRALEAADALQPGQSVCVLTPLLPIPLLDALAARGLHTSAVTLPDGAARVLIRRDDDGPTGA
jgi:uncharacterized protein (DUF2249 family)